LLNDELIGSIFIIVSHEKPEQPSGGRYTLKFSILQTHDRVE